MAGSAGAIRFDGSDIAAWQTPAIAELGIAYVPETMGIFADLTVQENLLLAARRGPPDEARLEWIFGFFPALKKFWHLPAGKLSGGQKQMLAIARAIVEPRRLLLIDEPTKGLAPAIIDNLIDAFGELKKTGTTILLVEQNFHVGALAGRHGRGDGRRPHRARRPHGGAGGRRGAAEAPARPVAGGSSMKPRSKRTMTPRTDWIPPALLLAIALAASR